MTAFLRTDIEIPESVSATAAAIAQRVASATEFSPNAVGTFTHATTAIETTIGSTASFPVITSTLVTSDLGAACASLETEVSNTRKLLNRVVYILEANGMTS